MKDLAEKVLVGLRTNTLSSYKIAQDTGISDQTITNYRNGVTTPKGNNLKILAKYLGVSGNFEKPFTEEIIISRQPKDADAISTGKLIPYYDAEVAAGINYDTDMIPSRPMAMIEIGGLLKESEAAIRVYGNSMVPNYPAGCVIGTRLHGDSFIEPGRVYIVETHSGRYLKRLYYNDDKTAYQCISDNHMIYEDGPRQGKLYYPEFEIPMNEVIRLHKVVGVIKRNEI